MCVFVCVCLCVCACPESLHMLKKQIAEVASELLENWTKLKEVFRIPKKVSVSAWDVPKQVFLVCVCVH